MDPVTATAGAAAIAGGADIIGSLLGSGVSKGESRNNRREARRQFNIQDDWNKNRINYTVQDALRSGVNPLAALSGSSGSYSPTVHTGGSSGAGDMISQGISNAGSRIQRAINSYYEIKNRQSIELDLESKRLQNDLLKSKLDTATQPGFIDPDSVVRISDVAINPELYSLDMIGKQSPYPSLLKKWRLPSGKVVQLLDADSIADTDFTNVEGNRAIISAYPFLRDGKGYRFYDKFSRGNLRRSWKGFVSRFTSKK